MSNYRPAQIFASFGTEAPKTTSKKHDLQKMEPSSVKPASCAHRTGEIQVTATGELCLPPDRCRLKVCMSSTKDMAQEAQNSVSRRLDYVKQTLRNKQVKEGDIHVSESLRRQDGLYVMEAEVMAHFTDFHKCQSTSNQLVEKLDESVKVFPAEMYHSPQKVENLRKQASLVAVRNAKQKAVEMAQFLHARLGQAVTIHEDSCQEWEGPASASDVDFPVSMQQRIDQLTLHVTVSVTASFEMKPKTKTKQAK